MNAWAAAVGVLAVAAWMATAPPWRDGPRGVLRGAASVLLLAGLFDLSCRLPAAPEAPRLVVLVDRSQSMHLGPPGGSREEAVRAWLEGPTFADWTEDWQVEVDSFGGATTDPGGAVERAADELPGAILVLTDGRTAGGRSIERAEVPVYGLVPEPVALADAAVLGLSMEGEGEADTLTVEVAAVGGLPVPGGRAELAIDGRTVGRRPVPSLGVGERRLLRFPLPAARVGHALVTARVVVAGDPVPENDARSVIREPPGPSRALVIALGPGWDFPVWVRALDRSHPGPVDAYWSFPGGGLRAVDGGATLAWPRNAVDRYAALYLVGNPAALGVAGRTWVNAFLGSGGRGLLWAPAGGEGELPGPGTVVAGSRPAAVPSLTEEGWDWLSALGARPAAVPDGGRDWPPLEDLPAEARPDSGATVLLSAEARAVAWIAERGTNRFAVTLGSGYYRWSIVSGAVVDPGPAFWEAWSGALARWLASASPAIRPFVRMPADRAVPASQPLQAELTRDAGAVRWRVERGDEEVARGEVEPGDSTRTLSVGPFPPGTYRLVVTGSQGRTATEPFVVETWSPDLAWTAADTASVAAAARGSGGAMIDPDGALPTLVEKPGGEPATAGGRRLGLGTWPWTHIMAALLILADWALARPRSR